MNQEIDTESEKWLSYLEKRETLRNREESKREKLTQLVDVEYEYRVFFQKKSMMLSDLYRNMENLLINIDKTVL